MVSSLIIDPTYYSTLCAFILNAFVVELVARTRWMVTQNYKFCQHWRGEWIVQILSMIILWTRIIGMRLNCAFSSYEQNFVISYSPSLALPVWCDREHVFYSTLPTRTVSRPCTVVRCGNPNCHVFFPLPSTLFINKFAFLQSETIVPGCQTWQEDFPTSVIQPFFQYSGITIIQVS